MNSDRYINTPQRHIPSIHAAAGYTNTLCFINRTASVIYIKDRTGCITEIPQSTSALADSYPYACLIIQELCTVAASTHTGWRHQVRGTGEEYCTARQLARAAALPAEELRMSDKYTSITTFVVDLSGNIQRGTIRYVPDYDVVVIAGAGFDAAVLARHPATRVDQIKDSAKEFVADKDVYVKIRYIQNTEAKRKLYVILDGRVIEAIASRNDALEPGIYVSYRCDTTNKEMADYYTDLEDATAKKSRYRFFGSMEQALVALSESENEGQRLKLEEIRLKNEQLQATTDKARAEAENIKRKAREDELKHLQAVEENRLHRIRMREDAAMRAVESSRKNTTDSFKYVTTILSSLIAVGVVFLKK